MTSITFTYKLNINKYTPHRTLAKHMEDVGEDAWAHLVTPASDDPTGQIASIISLIFSSKWVKLSLCLISQALRHEGVWGRIYRSTFS
jgi:hypothetical protein